MKKFKKNKKKVNVLFLTLILCVCISINVLILINYKISPKLLKICEYSLNTYNNKLIMEFISDDQLSDSNLNDLISLVKNKKDEIIAVNYNMNNSYKLLKNITNELYEIFNKKSFKDFTDYNYDIKDDLVLYYPIGLASDYIYFNNLGPIIPVRIKFLDSIVTGINTKVSNYGINNVLVEMYVNISIENNIVIPFKEENIKKDYSVLLSSKLIVGQVPSYLGGTIENSRQVLSNN